MAGFQGLSLRKIYKIALILFLVTSPLFAIKKGERVREFMLRDYNGNLYYSRDLCGDRVKGPSVLIIDFFATWCLPCKQSVEVFKKLHSKYGKKGLRIVLISFQEKEGSIRKFANANGAPFPILMDKYGEMAKEFGVYGLPSTFVIDGDCRLRRQIIGELQNLEEELDKEVRDVLEIQR